jgi:peptidoglycan/LPS O-acetylase OafA/YrhL
VSRLKSVAIPKPYIHEVDLIRAVTAFTVVAIHSLETVGYLVTGTDSSQFYNLITHVLNYNREVFVFITGLVLTYIYLENPQFSVKKFYRNRFNLVFIPYVFWSIIYTLKNAPFTHFWSYVWLVIWNIITGNASPQLYYIILTLQAYLLFPLFLAFIRKVRDYPWRTLGISLIIQLLLLQLDFHYVQTGPLRRYSLTNHFLNYHSRIILAYGFFLILGGIAAVYIPQINSFYKRYGKQIAAGMLAVLVAYGLYFYVELNQFHEAMSHATTVLQPSVALYSTAVIVFFGWVAMLWAKEKRLHRAVKGIAEMSFGIFFVHYIYLTLLTQQALHALPFGMPVPVTIMSVLVLTFGLSVATCYLFLKTPWLSWTIGKASGLPKLRLRHLGVRSSER